MKNDVYNDQIEKLYAGEIYGEYLFTKMAERQQDRSKTRQIWQLISEVEKLTGQRLQPLALRLGVDKEGLLKGALERGEHKLKEFSEMNEFEIANYYRPLIPENLLRLSQLVSTAPIDDRPVLEKVVLHSELFRSSMDAIIQGSQNEVVKLLNEFLSNGDVEKNGS
jgi:hypothetical protein